MTLAQFLPYVLSIGTLAINVMAGNKWRYTFAVALINQAVWFFWIFWTGNYGFIILNTFLTIIYVRNHIRWTHEPRRRPKRA